MSTTSTAVETVELHHTKENQEEYVVVDIGIKKPTWKEGLGQRVIAQAVKNRRRSVAVEQNPNNQSLSSQQCSVIVSRHSIVIEEQTEPLDLSFKKTQPLEKEPVPVPEPAPISKPVKDDHLFKVPVGRAPKRKLNVKDHHWQPEAEDEGSRFSPRLRINPNHYRPLRLSILEPPPCPEKRVIKYAKRSSAYDVHDIMQEFWLEKIMSAPVYATIFNKNEHKSVEKQVQDHFRKSLLLPKNVKMFNEKQQEREREQQQQQQEIIG